MPKLKTKEQFIDDAIKKHGDKYDYSLVNYTGTYNKVKIICKEHGIFEQSPKAHIRNIGCPKCTYDNKHNNPKMIINNHTSYMIGLFQTDGSISSDTRNRGKFQLELSLKDEDIIYKLKNIIPYYSSVRKRLRNIKLKGHEYNKEFISITISDLNFRNELLSWGIPYGKKSKIIKPPLHLENLSIDDYVRGLIDGDGSLGLDSKNLPFIGFTTDSDDIAFFLTEYISKVTCKPLKNIKRNKRDNIYNICIRVEDAVNLCQKLYYKNCLCLNRKLEKSEEMNMWIRPLKMRKVMNAKKWTDEQDEYILNHDVEESMKYLKRSQNSIEMRLWRLKVKIN